MNIGNNKCLKCGKETYGDAYCKTCENIINPENISPSINFFSKENEYVRIIKNFILNSLMIIILILIILAILVISGKLQINSPYHTSNSSNHTSDLPLATPNKKFKTEPFIRKSNKIDNLSSKNNESHNTNEAKPDFAPYIKEIQIKIKRNWNPPERKEAAKTIVLFKITRDGRLISVKILKSSGNSDIDISATRAIERAAPFNPLPAEYKGLTVDIQFVFDYKIFKGSGIK